ncbi:MAG: KUP/HAK/KT family potassium transporter [Phycisphaerae bacterium]|nr:KUP/HAK/KT family potassium transporter [Phycisphaerae bacterium]
MSTHQAPHGSRVPLKTTLALALGALGVVYGDIGTSPLYALKESFQHLAAVTDPAGQPAFRQLARDEVLGVLSLVFWSMTLVVSAKYLLVITRAANRGEGGIFALLSLVPRSLSSRLSRVHKVAVLLAMLGAGLLYGDGIITPSISVLSAMEGLTVVSDKLTALVLPATVVILCVLFAVQQFGTGRIGVVFGPVMLVWFLVLAILGIAGILREPHTLLAINPYYSIAMFLHDPVHAFMLLGSVVLVITGGEALYADMGHFGIRPIRLSWYTFAAPALALNYFGQGALVLSDPTAVANPFYAMVPGFLQLPMVALATVATVIASQAMISGVFSLAQQAIRLGYLPRLQVVHTSGEHKGQIYVPTANWLMLMGCLLTVAIFPSSSQLAGAYGIAVTAQMGITTILFAFVARRLWRWKRRLLLPIITLALAIDLLFFASNAMKILSGGWFTLIVAFLVFVVLSTWVQGSYLLGRRIAEESTSIYEFIGEIWARDIPRVPGTAVFLATNYNTPHALAFFVEHAHVLHERVILLSIQPVNAPFVSPQRSVQVEWLPDGLWKVTARCGFMQTPNVPRILERAKTQGLDYDPETTTFFSRRVEIVPTGKAKMPRWQKLLYAALARNTVDTTRAFSLPPERVVDFGSQISL